MDKKMLKEIMKKKLESEYIYGAMNHESYKLDVYDFRRAGEAYAMIALLDSCENPLLAIALAEKMDICPTVLSDEFFWNDIISACCTADEIQSLKAIRYLFIYSRMTEQEREGWWEEAMELLEKWDRPAKRGTN